MAQATINEKALKKLNHLKEMVYSIFEEIKEIEMTVTKKKLKKDPLCGLLKGIEISDKDIEKAKKMWDYPVEKGQ